LKHFAAPQFWECYRGLPLAVRRQADKCFELMKEDPKHPSLRLKKVGGYYAARVGLQYRTLAVEAPDGLVWFWIGSHSEYDRIVGG
jgi:hypothetical protein